MKLSKNTKANPSSAPVQAQKQDCVVTTARLMEHLGRATTGVGTTQIETFGKDSFRAAKPAPGANSFTPGQRNLPAGASSKRANGANSPKANPLQRPLPAWVQLQQDGQAHAVMVTEVRDQTVLYRDPLSGGPRTLALERFEKMLAP